MTAEKVWALVQQGFVDPLYMTIPATILAYTAMAGAAGGDGLGKIAITYGLNRREYGVMYAASIALVVLVQVFQLIGNILTKALDHRHR